MDHIWDADSNTTVHQGEEAHNHIQEPHFQLQLQAVIDAARGLSDVTIEQLSPAFRHMREELRRIWSSDCPLECKAEVERVAVVLGDLRSAFLARLSRGMEYPDYGQLRELAMLTKREPTVEHLYALLNTTEDLMTQTTEVQDSFALRASIEALEYQSPDQVPLPYEEDRKAWYKPGYHITRMLQYRLTDRERLIPVFKSRLEQFTDLSMTCLLEDRIML